MDTRSRIQEEVRGISYSFLLAEEFAFLTHFLFMLSSLGLKNVLISQVCLHLSLQHLDTQKYIHMITIILGFQCMSMILRCIEIRWWNVFNHFIKACVTYMENKPATVLKLLQRYLDFVLIQSFLLDKVGFHPLGSSLSFP